MVEDKGKKRNRLFLGSDDSDETHDRTTGNTSFTDEECEIQISAKKPRGAGNPEKSKHNLPKDTSRDTEVIVVEEDVRNEQVEEINDDDEIEIIEKPTNLRERQRKGEPAKSITKYQCPICLEAPNPAMITKCGHVFCTECLFDMLNSSRTYTKPGTCALCRTNIPFSRTNLIVMKFKTVKK